MLYRSLEEIPVVVSVPELAEILRVSRNTAYAMVRSGQIPSVRTGAQIRISKSALLDYLNVA